MDNPNITKYQKYALKNPILSFRVTVDILKHVDEIVDGRKKYQSGFDRQEYLFGLLEKDLRGMGRL